MILFVRILCTVKSCKYLRVINRDGDVNAMDKEDKNKIKISAR